MEKEPQAANTTATQNSLALLLDEIELRATKVPSAPWIYGTAGDPHTDRFWVREKGEFGIGQHICFVHYGNAFQNEDRAAFIASSRTDVPALVKALRRARQYIQPDMHSVYDAEIMAILEGLDE